MNENYVYPAIIEPDEEGGVCISIPNFNKEEYADNETEAVKNAQEMLAACIIDNEKRGKKNPAPTEADKLQIGREGKIVYIHVWMPYFRKEEKEVYVKKTLTIPKGLDILAKENNINFSAVLVKALKQELGIER